MSILGILYMWTERQLVLASGNQGKIHEFSRLFSDFETKVIPQQALNIQSPEETGLSFIENAILKARHASNLANLPSLADDSGLVVPSLDGEPGLYSARYAETYASDEDNISLLLKNMQSLLGNDRRAHYICALALVRYAADPDPIVVIGRWHGRVLARPKGERGFGYDPIFLPNDFDQTAAELEPDLKSRLSHRGLAVVKLHALLC